MLEIFFQKEITFVTLIVDTMLYDRCCKLSKLKGWGISHAL